MKADTKRAVALLLLVCHWGGMLHSQAPEWWVTRQARDPALAPDDFALVNQGQLKQLARAAFLEMEARTPGGAGPQITALVQSWLAPATAPRDDYAVANIGQLKAVAAPFHARLQELGVAVPFTWTAVTTDDDDFAPANIGQAKALFAFAIPDADALLPPEVLAYKNTYGGLFGEDSPFVIHYADWRCNQVRTHVGETRTLGWTDTWQWHLPQGDQACPQKQKTATHYAAIPYDMPADDWINSHTDPVPPFTQRTVDLEFEHTYTPDPALVTRIQEFEILRQFAFPGGQPLDFNRQLKQVWWVHSGATGESLWESLYPGEDYSAKLASHGSHRYETPAQTWRVSSHDPSIPLLPAAGPGQLTPPHLFEQNAAGGPASPPQTGWTAPPAEEVHDPLAALAQNGNPIPFQPLKMPASGGIVAIAQSQLEVHPMHHLPASGQPVLEPRCQGAYHRGKVLISWRPGLRPQDMTAQVMNNWIQRYKVIIEETVYHADGTQPEPVTSTTDLSTLLTPSSSTAQIDQLDLGAPDLEDFSPGQQRLLTLRLENLVPVVQDPDKPGGTGNPGGPNGTGGPNGGPDGTGSPENPEIFTVYLETAEQNGTWKFGNKMVPELDENGHQIGSYVPSTFSSLQCKLIKPAEDPEQPELSSTWPEYYWRYDGASEPDWLASALHSEHLEPADHEWEELESLPCSPERAADRQYETAVNGRPKPALVANFSPTPLQNNPNHDPGSGSESWKDMRWIDYHAAKVRLCSTEVLPAGYEQSFILVKEVQKPPPYAPGQYDHTVLGTHLLKIEPGDNGTQSDFTHLVDFSSEEIAKAYTQNQSFHLRLLPVDLATDLNNDGQITSADSSLREAATKSGASDADKEKGTEYLFINDKMSNGVWDADDDGVMSYSYGSGYSTMPKPPAAHKDDDDAQALKVSVGGLNTGVVWFDHSVIDKLEFFKTKECTASDKLNITASSPFDLSTGSLPETIYVRLRDDWAGVDSEGTLRMFVGKTINETWAELKLPLTVVRDFGAKHFFHAARDYIMENNARVCIRDHGYPFGPNPSVIFRLCVMREEATKMTAFDALAGGQAGIEMSYFALPAVPRAPAVMVNGNQCFWSAGWDEKNPFDLPNMLGNIADKCHGRVIRGGVTATTSSDNFDNTTKPAAGSPLAGPDPIPAGTLAGPDGVPGTSDDIANPYAGDPGGKYLGCNSGAWTFAAGRAGGSDALGGLSTNYASAERADKAHQMIGYAKGEETGKGCIFTATQIKGVGYGPIVKSDASTAGVPALTPSADAGAIKLFILDSGAGSLALMHLDPTGTMRGAYMGRKTNFGFPYYVNNYLALDPAPPRP